MGCSTNVFKMHQKLRVAGGVGSGEAVKGPHRRERGKEEAAAHRRADDAEQGLVAVDADLSVGQSGHDGLQAPGALLQEVHGQDGCGHLHCPQPLTLRGGQGTVKCLQGAQGLRVERRGGWSCWEGKAGRARLLRGTKEAWVEGLGLVLAQRPHLVGEAMQAVLVAAHHQDLVNPDKPHGLGTQLDAVLGALGVSVE